MHLSLSLNTALNQTLTPQQVQYLKLLQLTNLQLEQYLQQEIEVNPMLDETQEGDQTDLETEPQPVETIAPLALDQNDNYDAGDDHEPAPASTIDDFDPHDATNPDDNTWQDYIDDEEYRSPRATDDDNDEPFPMRSLVSFVEELIDQLRLLPLSDEEKLLGENILWNIESSGYLERNLLDIVDETNEQIRERNFAMLQPVMAQAKNSGSLRTLYEEISKEEEEEESVYSHIDTADLGYGRMGNPLQPEVGSNTHQAMHVAEHSNGNGHGVETTIRDFARAHNIRLFEPVTLPQAELVLRHIQKLDPPGIGARDLRECLLAQLDALPRLNAAQKLAREVLVKSYDSFRMKHFDVILRTLKVSENYLREALEVIRSLNPKPGGGDISIATHTVIPDFFIEYDEDKDDFLVRLNDSRLPTLHINKEYEKVRKEARRNKFNKDTREWLRKKYDDAKFLIQAMNQRRDTMRKVITAIVHRQRDFFRHGENYLRPLIYRDIADDTGLDISTVCRVVNGKYAQTDYGVFELRYFFSESLESDEGEDISTKVIKNKLKEIIESEPKNKPHSDDKLAKEMKKLGYNVARRTVAKYREQMKIPVARLRKEL
jgi:RNA polymerase sigma-54 factor